MAEQEQEHAKHSPSQLHRIIACPQSARLCEGELNETSGYAEEGTMLHKVMEHTLATWHNLGVPVIPDNLSLMSTKIEPLTREQRRACEGAAEYYHGVLIEAFIEGVCSVELEAKSSLAFLNMPTCYGTTDVRIKTPKTLHILDWKFGQGIEVHVKDNPQFLAYALGSVGDLVELLAYDRIVTHVVQPRLNNYYGQEYTPQELILWGEEILRPALIATETDGPCHPGVDQCRWCLAKHKCKARYEYAARTAQEIFTMYAQGEDTITDERVAHLLRDAKMLEYYIKDLKTRALDQCCSGKGFPGFKAVSGRTSRSWKNEEAAREFLLARADQGEFSFEDLFESKFLSPPKAEKLTRTMKKDEEFLALIAVSPGAPTLVPETDPRAAYRAEAAQAFAAFL